LQRWHERAGATMMEEQGWSVPFRYSNVEREAGSVLRSVGICDLSHIHDPLSPNARFLIAGPSARALLGKLTSLNLDRTPAQGPVAHVRSMLMRHEIGFLLMPPRDYAESVWEALLHAGEEFHVTAFGLEALRMLEG